MKNIRKWLLLLALAWVCGPAAQAHPLTGLTADARVALLIGPERIRVVYQVDYAEASGFTRFQKADTDHDGQLSAAEREALLAENRQHFQDCAQLTVQGQKVRLEPVSSQVEVVAAPSGLMNLKTHYEFSAPWPLQPDTRYRLQWDDQSWTGTAGWRSIEVQGEGGVGILVAPTPARNAVEAQQTEAQVEFHLGPSQAAAATAATPTSDTGQSRLMEMLRAPQFTPQMLLMALVLAFGLGALHALTPGHGKTLVGAYLIGSRGTIGQAVLLGVVVTVTHTASVFLLGFVCMAAFQYVMPDQVVPWIGFLSGVLICAMGLYLLEHKDEILAHDHSHAHGQPHSHWPGAGHSHASGGHSHGSGGHSHASGGHSHASGGHTHEAGGHGQESGGDGAEGSAAQAQLPATRPYAGTVGPDEAGESDGPDHANHQHGERPGVGAGDIGAEERHADKVSLISLLGLGISGGMMPCPDALVVLLSAIALNRLWLGMLVLVAFSAGLAAVLVAVGILMVTAGRLFEKAYPSDRLVRRVTTASYIFITIVGLVICIQSLRSAGMLAF